MLQAVLSGAQPVGPQASAPCVWSRCCCKPSASNLVKLCLGSTGRACLGFGRVPKAEAELARLRYCLFSPTSRPLPPCPARDFRVRKGMHGSGAPAPCGFGNYISQGEPHVASSPHLLSRPCSMREWCRGALLLAARDPIFQIAGAHASSGDAEGCLAFQPPPGPGFLAG